MMRESGYIISIQKRFGSKIAPAHLAEGLYGQVLKFGTRAEAEAWIAGYKAGNSEAKIAIIDTAENVT